MTKHIPTYNSWKMMKQRCENPRASDFFRYGGRGIKVSEELATYESFVEYLDFRPEGMSLDRIDPKKDYTWENCRWADNWRQNANRGWDKYWTWEARGDRLFVFFYNGKEKLREREVSSVEEAVLMVNNSGEYA